MKEGRVNGEVANESDWNMMEEVGYDLDEIAAKPQETTRDAPKTAKPLAQPKETVPQAPVQAKAPEQASPVPAQTPAQAPAQPAPAPQEATDTGPVSIDQVVSAIEQGGDWTKNVIASFALTKDQAAALEADPITEIPNLMGQAYMRAVATSLKYMQQLVPTMIAQQQLQVQRAQEAESAFFSRWKQLDKAQHGNAIRAFGQAFKAANPGMSQQDLIEMVGAAVAAKYGLAATAMPPQQQAPARSAAFVPATSTAPVAQGQIVQTVPDFFAGMANDYE